MAAAEGYNHVGDISWHRGGGGRVLLPLECFTPGAPNGGNTCGTGSIGVADPATLAFRYYVKLDPAEIAKAMWVESSPDGRLLWTSSGSDLLAYRAADVTAARAAPAGAPLRSVRRLAGAVPPSGVTGAAFVRGRLLLAGARGTTYQVWSVDTRRGTRRLELELPRVQGEAEGLHAMRLMNGELHWLIAPLAVEPTFPPSVALLHFTRARGRPGLRLSARATAAQTKRPRISIRVTRRGRPVPGAVVTLADAGRRTDRGGRVTLMPRLAVPGNYAAVARRRRPARDDEALPARLRRPAALARRVRQHVDHAAARIANHEAANAPVLVAQLVDHIVAERECACVHRVHVVDLDRHERIAPLLGVPLEDADLGAAILW